MIDGTLNEAAMFFEASRKGPQQSHDSPTAKSKRGNKPVEQM